MSELTTSDFAAFYEQVHGHQPFPWQSRLAEHVLTQRRWPQQLDVPTGLGKTSVLDIASFTTAAGAGPRRVFFVVDRRLVVDEAHTHAQRLAAALRNPTGAITALVAKRLSALASSRVPGEPVSVTRMRGGASWDWRWLDRPDRFGIVLGTVDQIGSRLLFRAYGTTPRLAPIDAALVGTDALLFVDEAHLSEPFLHTVTAVQDLDRPQRPVAAPTRLVRLTATHRPGTPEAAPVFDLADNLADPEAARRLRAAKYLITATCPARQLTDVLAQAADLAAREHPGGLLGVVVNTVAQARAVHTRLRTLVPAAEALLLTGRTRPADRDRVLAGWADRIMVGWRTRQPEGRTTRFLVATQTVEVGANIDLDVLITESAPWDALVQRLGRLNRVGHGPATATAVIIHPSTTTPDLVYGEPRQHAWDWLTQHQPPLDWPSARAVTADRELFTNPDQHGLMVNPEALRALRAPAEAVSTTPRVPEMFAQHLHGWVRTAPIPIPDAPVAPFLHGAGTTSTTVRLLWRADMHPHDTTAWARTVELIPPRTEEILEVPLSAVRAWLTGATDTTVLVDLEHEPAAPERPAIGDGRAVLLLRADQNPVVLTEVTRLRAEDVLVVPATYGGLDEFGWAPEATAPVVDVAELAPLGARRRPVLRLNPATLPPLIAATGHPDTAATIAHRLKQLTVLLDKPDPDDERELPTDLPAPHPHEPGEPELAVITVLADLHHHLQRWWSEQHPGSPMPTKLLPLTPRPTSAADLVLVRHLSPSSRDESAEGSSTSDRQVTLAEHHTDVGNLAEEFAANLNLEPRVHASVVLAARWHDLGKLDPRFQAMLHHGSRLAAEAAPAPLAKSGMDPADRTARRRAQQASGYPQQARHEALSAFLAQQLLATGIEEEVDGELLTHLVAAHHGHSRPLLPPVTDDQLPGHIDIPADCTGLKQDTTVELTGMSAVDWESCERFQALCQRYGHWGVALLEALVRLADIACSAGDYPAHARAEAP